MADSGKNLKRICILCMLADKPKHGYEIMKELESRFGKKSGPGTVYPMLSLLKKKGYIKIETEEKKGRNKKVYSLTTKGKEECKNEKECIKRILKEFF